MLAKDFPGILGALGILLAGTGSGVSQEAEGGDPFGPLLEQAERMIENAKEEADLSLPEAVDPDLAPYFSGLQSALQEDEIVDEAGRAEALEIVAEAVELEELTVSMATQALMAAYPEFGDATLDVLANGSAGHEARDLLREMAELPNPYLAAECSYYYGRALISEDRYDEAIPYFEAAAGRGLEGCLNAAEAQYYKGFCQAELLQRDAAADTLNNFIDNSPWAAKHLRASAEELVNSMERVEDGSIGDVADHMNYSGRRLDFDDPGESTQAVQDRIIEMLDDLIEKAEESEFQQQSGSGGQGQGKENQQGSQPGSSQGSKAGGNAQEQKPPRVLRRARGAARSAWDDLRDREREGEALGSLNENLPPRYRSIVEQYYRDLQEGVETEEE